MPRPENINTIEDIKIWIADHDGRIDAYWDEQHRWNSKMEDVIESIGLRLTSVEKKIMWFAGASAAVGSVVGAFVANTLA